MTSRDRESPDLTPADRAFVERLRQDYTPPPMSPAERVTFGAALEARLSRRRLPLWKPLVVVACAAALALWFALPSGIDPAGQQTEVVQRSGAEQRGELLVALALDTEEDLDTTDFLPEDYETIVRVFELDL